jgi:uncharacterized protein involved in exopolysaccharide biosynthesis
MLNGFAETPGDMQREAEEQSGNPALGTLGRALKRSWLLVALLILLGTGVGLAAALVVPNTYSSTAKLLLRVGARERITSESLVGLVEEPHVPLPRADELQMLSDVEIFKQVAQKVGPEAVLRPAPADRADDEGTSWPIRAMHELQTAWFSFRSPNDDLVSDDPAEALRRATKTLVENSDITNELGSNVILVTHESTSPEKARTVVQALTDAFIERHREQFSIQPLVEKARGTVEDARRSRDAATSAYFDHLSQCGFGDITAQSATLLTEVNTLDSQLFDVSVRRKAIEKQQPAQTTKLSGVPSVIETVGPAVMKPNEEYETLIALKRELNSKRLDMRASTLPIQESRRMEDSYNQQLAEINKALNTMQPQVEQTTQIHENSSYSALRTRISDLEVEDLALTAEQDLLRERLASRREELARLRECEPVHQDMIARRDVVESRYEHLQERFAKLEALAGIDLHEEANLRVLQRATLDKDKVGPKRPGMILKGMLAGTLAAIAVALLRQQVDRKLRYPETFERSRGVPVLGVVPDTPSLRRITNGAPAKELWP